MGEDPSKVPIGTRPPRVFRWRGEPVDFVRDALRYGRPELASLAGFALEKELRRQWHLTLHGLQYEHKFSEDLRRQRYVPWSDDVYAKLRTCTKVLVSSNWSRFCDHSWGCPDCYGRRLWTLVQQLRKLPGRLQLLTDIQYPEMVLRAPSPLLLEEAEELWQDQLKLQKVILKEYRHTIHWRQVAPCHTSWALRSAWVVPGEETLEELYAKLVCAFRYPHDYFDADPLWVAYCLRFMERHRGRSITRDWSKLQD